MMRRLLKVLGILLAVLLVIVLGGVTWLALKKPQMRAPSAEVIERTPERIARGHYLANYAFDCFGCHSQRVTDRFGMPIKPGTEGMGGFTFTKEVGVPGVVTAQNITSDRETGIGAWTDGEVLRSIREGINKEGEAMFPMMPYEYFKSMSDEDARAVVAYLRTLPPVKNETPARKIDFPVNFLIKSAPKPVTGPVAAPDPKSDPVGYGKYLVTMGGCIECHTAHDARHQVIKERALAGGFEMIGPWGRVVTANITPHPATFVGRATKDVFVARFKAYEKLDNPNAPVVPPGRNTVMPWLPMSHMTEADLGYIYDYLKTVKPIENHVVPFPGLK